jgi:hypothetical protein
MLAHDRALVERFQDRPFELIGVDCNDGDVTTAAPRLAQEGVTWRTAVDDERASLAARWNVRTVPQLYLIDAGGVIRERWLGVPDERGLERAIEALVQEARHTR